MAVRGVAVESGAPAGALAAARCAPRAARPPHTASSGERQSSLFHLGPFGRRPPPAGPRLSARPTLVSRSDASLSAPRSWPAARGSAPAAPRAAPGPGACPDSGPPPAASSAAVARARTCGRAVARGHTAGTAAAARGIGHSSTDERTPTAPSSGPPFSCRGTRDVMEVTSSDAPETLKTRIVTPGLPFLWRGARSYPSPAPRAQLMAGER